MVFENDVVCRGPVNADVMPRSEMKPIAKTSLILMIFATTSFFSHLVFAQSAGPTSPANTAQVAGFWMTLVDKNPGIGTVAISAVVSGFLVPVIMLYLNNRHTRQIKQLDATIDLKKSDTKRKQDETASRESQTLEYESTIHSCLVKILFGVQQLHVDLSGTCINPQCVDDAITHFQKTLTDYQTKIAEKQLLLAPGLTNLIYGYYANVSELLIELREISHGGHLDLAIVSVHEHATSLADQIVGIQNLILRRRQEITNDLRPEEFSNMRSCCGKRPPQSAVQKYRSVVKDMHRFPIEILEDAASSTTTTTTSISPSTTTTPQTMA